MTPEIFAEWMRRQGRRVFRTESTYWHSQELGAYQAFPYHWVIQPSSSELLEFIRENRVLSLRYSAPADTNLGCPSYHVVRDNPAYGLNSLSKRACHDVRNGVRECEVAPISFERLAGEGWALEQDTLSRQGRKSGTSQKAWRLKCLAASDLPGFEAWGTLLQGRLAGSLIACQIQDCCYILSQQSRREYLKAFVNNTLSFVVTQTLLSRPGVRSVLYSLHSLDAPASMDQFKFRMGYRAKPVRQRVVFHPWLSPMMNGASHALLRFALALRPRHPVLSKAEGMLRFYLQGRPAAAQQTAPACLQDLSAE
jgi:hypothetical protein